MTLQSAHMLLIIAQNMYISWALKKNNKYQGIKEMSEDLNMKVEKPSKYYTT